MTMTMQDDPEARIARRLRHLIDVDEDLSHIVASELPFASKVTTPRQLQLEDDFVSFRHLIRTLRSLGRVTMPGIYFETESVPASPRNAGPLYSRDPTSVDILQAWTAHLEGAPHALHEQVREGSVIAMPLTDATRVFTNGIAAAYVAAGSGGSNPLVDFTVNSQNAQYRIHVTERYWFNPTVFGGSKLSTPVDDQLYPGDYRFGGDKGGSPILWDSGIHTVSALKTSTNVMTF